MSEDKKAPNIAPSGWVTTALRPRPMLTSPRPDRIFKASRTVMRLTPKSAAISASDGSCAPGRRLVKAR